MSQVFFALREQNYKICIETFCMSRNLEITLRQIEYVCVGMSSSRKICTHFTLIDVVHAIVKEQEIVFAIIQSRWIRNICTLVKKTMLLWSHQPGRHIRR